VTDALAADLLASRSFRAEPAIIEDIEAVASVTPPGKTNHGNLGTSATTRPTAIRFYQDELKAAAEKTLYIPPPHLRDKGHPLIEIERNSGLEKKRTSSGSDAATTPDCGYSRGRPLERVASTGLVLGPSTRYRTETSASRRRPNLQAIPSLSKQVTVGRNSHFQNLSVEDKEVLGGVEYAALNLLLKIIVGQ
jgi:hypothetical protein